RGLIPIAAKARAMRAKIMHTSTVSPSIRDAARDSAEAGRRMSTHTHSLPWQELAALRVLADIDTAEGIDHGFAEKAVAPSASLIPSSLHPDPLPATLR